MVKRLLVVGTLILASAGTDLLACGDKFLVVSRGTRFQRASAARQPAKILVYANPTSPLVKALEKVGVDETLRKAGYQPIAVTDTNQLELALRQGGWDLVLADLADGGAIRGRLLGDRAPMVLPIAYNATGTEISQAKKDYQRIIKGPFKSQAFLDAVDDALALRAKLLKSKTA